MLIESAVAYLSIGVTDAHGRVEIEGGKCSDGIRDTCLVDGLLQGILRVVQLVIRLEEIVV